MFIEKSHPLHPRRCSGLKGIKRRKVKGERLKPACQPDRVVLAGMTQSGRDKGKNQ
jgi:hypothetical protein